MAERTHYVSGSGLVHFITDNAESTHFHHEEDPTASSLLSALATPKGALESKLEKPAQQEFFGMLMV